MAKKDIEKQESETKKMTCGIIMPISPHPDYPQDHWNDVLTILTEAVSETDFEPKLVSDDVAIGLIHDRIVTNIYNNEMVICDVSSKNPNVMFELGLRLAFDKPTIIIKDETTGYSFDTGVIEHISYPSSLRFSQIVKFKEELIRRINATYTKSISEPQYSPFLKTFGKTIVPATMQHSKIPEGEFILAQLENLGREVNLLRMSQRDEYNIQSKKYGFLNSIERRKMIEFIIGNYANRYTYLELMKNNDLFNGIRNELSINGVEISKAELNSLLVKYHKRDLTERDTSPIF